MKASYASLMQSKFFTPSFNSAIFDGPIRIYFSQIHEAFGLKLYFHLQNSLAKLLPHLKEEFKKNQKMILVMIYPSKDSFEYSFENHEKSFFETSIHEENLVFGVNGPLDDNEMQILAEDISVKINQQINFDDSITNKTIHSTEIQ